MKSEIRLMSAGLLLLLLIAASCQQQSIAASHEQADHVVVHPLD